MFNLLEELQNGDYLFPNTIEEIDQFSGKEFETFLFYFFKKHGYQVRMTNDSNDKGIDIIVTIPPYESNPKTILGIQAKRWASNVTSQEIRNIIDGKDEYNCDKLWLITTSDVTREANNTASNQNIEIKNRADVIRYLNDLKSLPGVKFRKKEEKNISQNKIDNTSLNVLEKDLYEELRTLRRQKAKEVNMSLFCIFSNETILNIVKAKPKTIDELNNIKGLGPKKIKEYGTEIIETIEKYDF